MKILTTTLAIVAAASMATALACPKADKQLEANMSDVKTGMVSPGKARAAIEIGHNLKTRAAIGQPMTLDLPVTAKYSEAVTVQVRVPDALGGGSYSRTVANGDTLRIDLLPQHNGRHLISLVARDASGAGPARVVSIPVQVGAPVKTASKASRTADGELIVRLPASE